MKKALAAFLAVLLLGAWTQAAFAKRPNKPQKPAAKKERVVEAPCQALIVTDAATGKVLEEQNAHERRGPASITKLMVALIVMEKLARGEIKLEDKIRVTKEASKIGGSQVFLAEGEEFTLEEMIRAMMIASANDAAYAISEHIAGSSPEFVALMNERAKALGMKDTEFHTVHGLPPGKDQKEDLTSAYDLAILGRELLKHPKLLEWTATKSAGFREGKFGLNNTNKLLTKMPEVDGLKTGFYRACGFNIVATAKKGELRFIVVVMGSPTGKIRDTVAMEKLRKYFAEYTVQPLVKKGEQVDKDVILDDGKFRKLKGIAAADLSVPVLRCKKKEVKRTINLPARLAGEVRQGQKLGELVFELDNEVVGRVDIVSPVYVPKANLFTRLIRKLGLNI